MDKENTKVLANRLATDLTKMEYAMIHGISTPATPAEFIMASLKNDPTWVRIKEDNPSVKSESAIVSVFKTKYEMEYLAACTKAEQLWRIFYYEKMFENIDQWSKDESATEENPVIRDLFQK